MGKFVITIQDETFFTKKVWLKNVKGYLIHTRMAIG